MKEIWKDIKGYEGYYQISNFGRVKSLSRTFYTGSYYKTTKDIIMKQQIINSGYNLVHIVKNKRKAFTVHRLVAICFIPNPENKKYVNHKDGNKLNNNVNNLSWCTGEENMRHAIDNGLWNPYERTIEQRKNTGIRMSNLHKGVKKTEEHNKKNSEAHKGVMPKISRDRAIRVKDLETGVIYESIRCASRCLGISKEKVIKKINENKIIKL